MYINAIALSMTILRMSGFEKFRSKPYVCPAGCWTIGYGSLWLKDGQPVRSTTAAISEADAATLLLQSVSVCDAALLP